MLPITVLLIFFASLVFADHGQVEPRLAGTTFCLDSRSVRTDLSGPASTGGQTSSLKRELRRQLEDLLESAEVRYEKRQSCAGERATILMSVEARYLEPETYLGFPDNAYTYTMSVRVGTPAGAPDVSDAVLENYLYSATLSDIVPVSDMSAQFLGIIEPTLSELAQVWRQDNFIPTAQYLIFAGIALLLVAARAILTLAL